jgi:hypothetical protein
MAATISDTPWWPLMDWSNERYVRLYTRDTTDWQVLSFEAQGLMALLMRKVDRAGVLPFGKQGRRGDGVAVALAVCHPSRVDAIGAALEELLADGCITIRDREGGRELVIPNFITAQEATMSDRQRQKVSRERRRDGCHMDLDGVTLESRNVTSESRNVTPTSRPVTGCHEASQPVTPALPSFLALSTKVLSSESEHSDALPLSNGQQTEIPGTPPAGPSPKDLGLEQAITEVLTHWRERAKRPLLSITGPRAKDRRKRIRDRLGDRFTIAELKRVADGMLLDDWLMGRAANSTKAYSDVETVYRDRAQCERLIELAAGGKAPQRPDPALRPRLAEYVPPPDPVLPATPEERRAHRLRLLADAKKASDGG